MINIDMLHCHENTSILNMFESSGVIVVCVCGIPMWQCDAIGFLRGG